MILTVVVVSWNTCALLDKCLLSLRAEVESSSAGSANVEVFVVDNRSRDGSAEMVAAKHAWVKLIRNEENRGFAAANNQVLSITRSPYVMLLNPDTEIGLGTLGTLVEFLERHQHAGIVAPQLLNSDGSIQPSCRKFPTFSAMSCELIGLSRMFPGVAKFRDYKMLDWNHNDERQVDQPEGACLLIRKAVLDEVGIFDESFFMLFEEVDLCYRAKEAGWEIWFTPAAKVVHHYGQSIKQVKVKMILSSHRGLYRFWFKHYRKGRWYLDSIAYLGLMLLAYVRICAYWLRLGLSGPIGSAAS
ncbi:MAG: glycosyltransferase family 2 protein [Candidatus Melainabacteria bacterium]|nr:MAG: glycosyltransferase family 2 protein [Candidatus Melainabacteria bacterium]